MNVLSLFDGISAGQVALERAGIEVDNYYAAEIDKYTIKVTQTNYPDTIQLGDVTKWREWDIDWASIDLLIGGSPCQGFSFAGKQLAFDDPRSALFFVYVDVLNHIRSVNPDVKFMLENVKMKKEYLAVISEQLGVEPVFINSALVSAQNRQRYYWANWEITQPEDKGFVLADIIEGGGVDRDKAHCIDANYFKAGDLKSHFEKHRRQLVFGVRATVQKNAEHCFDGKVPTITAAAGLGGGNVPLISDLNTVKRYKGKYIDKNDRLLFRKLTPVECERLQTFPDDYTAHVSNTQRYKALGNSWTVDVVAHIFGCGLL